MRGRALPASAPTSTCPSSLPLRSPCAAPDAGDGGHARREQGTFQLLLTDGILSALKAKLCSRLEKVGTKVELCVFFFYVILKF